MSEPMTKVTYALPADLVDEMRRMVRDGAAPSYSAFVEHAIRDRLDGERRRRLAEAFKDAANDPMFLGDSESVELEFEGADRETLRMIPE